MSRSTHTPGDPARVTAPDLRVGIASPSPSVGTVHHARTLALAVAVEALLAELAAERRRRRAVVERYECVLDRRREGRSDPADDRGPLERVREWVSG